MNALPDFARPLPALQASGTAFVIRCIPDPFTHECLNVGICVISADGQRQARAIEEPGRLECLYGDQAYAVVNMAQIAASCAIAGQPSPSEQIIFTEALPFYNQSPAQALESMFRDQVTVALPRRDDKKRLQLDDATALQVVTDALKQRIGLNIEILANTPNVVIDTERGKRALHIPLQPRAGVGIVRSADYTAATLKTHLLEGVLDLECAARARSKPDMGLFILRPKKSSKKQVIATDSVIDLIYVKTPKNLLMEVSDDEAALAEAIAHWAQ